MSKQNHAKGRLRFLFILGTAVVLLAALAVAFSIEIILISFEVIPIIRWGRFGGALQVIIFTGTSVIVGLLVALLVGRFVLKPINTMIDGMTALSNGEYSKRIELGKYEGLKELASGFNSLAVELEKTEMLRSDFVNEFAHELKTPIVSISGLVALLKNEELSPEKRAQYLAVMEEEAARLTNMTTNTLYLSKIETQGILTGVSKFNLSEQIRSCILLLEKKWEKKNLEPLVDFDEYSIEANEDMLKQVWLNLVDNAIKFADEWTELKIEIAKSEGSLSVTVTNVGDPIPEEKRPLIFGKFYQCDKSRSSEGNGIGLSIVKHIVTLHGGSISVDCKGRRTSFCVTLPTDEKNG